MCFSYDSLMIVLCTCEALQGPAHPLYLYYMTKEIDRLAKGPSRW